jgi:hypothetical protein
MINKNSIKKGGKVSDGQLNLSVHSLKHSLKKASSLMKKKEDEEPETKEIMSLIKFLEKGSDTPIQTKFKDGSGLREPSAFLLEQIEKNNKKNIKTPIKLSPSQELRLKILSKIDEIKNKKK